MSHKFLAFRGSSLAVGICVSPFRHAAGGIQDVVHFHTSRLMWHVATDSNATPPRN